VLFCHFSGRGEEEERVGRTGGEGKRKESKIPQEPLVSKAC